MLYYVDMLFSFLYVLVLVRLYSHYVLVLACLYSILCIGFSLFLLGFLRYFISGSFDPIYKLYKKTYQ